MKYEISCIQGYHGEKPKNTCFLVYFHNGNNTVPIAVFTEKEKAVAYCEKNPMIFFEYTKIQEIPLNDDEYEF